MKRKKTLINNFKKKFGKTIDGFKSNAFEAAGKTRDLIVKYDKKLYDGKSKVEKKIEKTKYIGKPAKHVFDINRRFDKSFPISAKVIDYALISPLLPIPFTSEIGIGVKTIGGGALKFKDILNEKKRLQRIKK